MTMGMPMMGPQEPPKPPKPEDGSVMAYWALAQAVSQIAQGTQRVIAEDGTILEDQELNDMAQKLMRDLENINIALTTRIADASKREAEDREAKKEDE